MTAQPVLSDGKSDPRASASLRITDAQRKPVSLALVAAAVFFVWLHAEFMLLADAHGQPAKVVATFIDISRLRAAEADTLAALKRQQELGELRARFVAMTSHEFRTPLAAILSSAELLQHYGERLAIDEKQQVLRGIHDGVHRMTHMLDRILLINKADAQMLTCHPKPVNLGELIEQIAAEVEQSAKVRRINVRLDVPQIQVSLDAKLVQHILSNLLSNALKYSPPQSPVAVDARTEGQSVFMVVTDRGIGISADDLPDLFEPFQRGGNVGERKGPGLGLTIVKKSVELHGGSIQVFSSAGNGTRFEVVLRQGVTT